jgi:type III pantothenate kinase
MNLVVDYGNSAAKVGIFDHQNLMEKHSFASAEALQKFLGQTTAKHIIISSVKTNPHVIASWVKNPGLKLILDASLPLPVKNLYATPATLGVDRIAAACGARELFPLQHCLTKDAGT